MRLCVDTIVVVRINRRFGYMRLVVTWRRAVPISLGHAVLLCLRLMLLPSFGVSQGRETIPGTFLISVRHWIDSINLLRRMFTVTE